MMHMAQRTVARLARALGVTAHCCSSPCSRASAWHSWTGRGLTLPKDANVERLLRTPTRTETAIEDAHTPTTVGPAVHRRGRPFHPVRFVRADEPQDPP